MSEVLTLKKLARHKFGSPHLTINKGKRKVLIVADKTMGDEWGEEPPTDRFIGDKRSATLKNVVNRALNEAIKEVGKLDCTLIFTAANSGTDSGNTKINLYNIIDDVKPDVVITMGSSVGTALFDDDPTVAYARLRKRKIKIGKKKRKFEALHSVPMEGWTDPRPSMKGDDGGGFVNLIGQVINHIKTGVTGKHNCTIKVPKKIEYTFIDTMEKFEKFYKKLVLAPVVSIDTEGTGLGAITSTMISAQFLLADPKDPFKIGKENLFFLPLTHRQTPFLGEEIKKIKRKLQHYFEFGKSKYHIYANGKYDVIQFRSNLGVRWYNHRMYEIQAGEFSHDENGKETKYVNGYGFYALASIEQRMGYYRSGLQISKSERSNMAAKPIKDIADYGMVDVVTPYLIHLEQLEYAKRRGYTKYLHNVIDQMGNTFIVFAMMEHRGMPVDVEYLTELQDENSIVNKTLRELNDKLKESAAVKSVNDDLCDERGHSDEGMFGAVDKPWLFDINDQNHQRRLFQSKLKLQPLKQGKSGKDSYDKGFQGHYKSIPEVAAYAEIQAISTIKNTFSTGLYTRLITDPDSIKDHRIRSKYELLRVLTGRTSSTKPNLQNIPTRGKWAKVIKRIFKVGKNKVLLKPDYSAHEIRGMGNIAKDPVIAKAFEGARKAIIDLRVCKPEEVEKYQKIWNTESDIHIQNVKLFFNKVVDSTHDLRYVIKSVVFGVGYGKGAPALAVDIFSKIRKTKVIKADKKAIKERIDAIKAALKGAK